MLKEVILTQEVSLIIVFCIRIMIAAVCGTIIGYERKKNFKAAGIRTHILVCCGAALFMIISKYAFSDISLSLGIKEADPARVAAQVVTGIGFLGAGVIFKNGVSIKGLTTAAGLWMTAGAGMAVGAGMIIVGVFSAVFIALIQFAMHKQALGIDNYTITNIKLIVEKGNSADVLFNEFLKTTKGIMTASKIVRHNDETTEYNVTFKVPSDLSYTKIEDFINKHKEIVSIERYH